MKGFVVLFVLLVVTLCHAADRYSILCHFEKGANDGDNQESISPVVRGSALYAATRSGGAQNKGTLFRINTDGTGFQVLHEFGHDPIDGYRPCGTLAADADTLYGMTTSGGQSNGRNGTIFRIGMNGAQYKTIHHFEGWYYNGDTPYGSLHLDAGKLHGLTVRGGPNDAGVLFRLNKDGAGFGLVYAFRGGRDDGANPYGSLAADADAFYGMTFAGGRRNQGVLFRLNKDGTGYKVLHHFTGGFDNGSNPVGSLLLHEDHLYGMTYAGGVADRGVIFRIAKDGAGFAVLRSFPGTGAEGSRPHGTLAFCADTLYGVTRTGGRSETGVLFSLRPDGSRFAVLLRFADPVNGNGNGGSNGTEPYGSLTAHDNALYGLTRRGGKGGGIVFRYQLPTP